MISNIALRIFFMRCQRIFSPKSTHLWFNPRLYKGFIHIPPAVEVRGHYSPVLAILPSSSLFYFSVALPDPPMTPMRSPARRDPVIQTHTKKTNSAGSFTFHVRHERHLHCCQKMAAAAEKIWLNNIPVLSSLIKLHNMHWNREIVICFQ